MSEYIPGENLEYLLKIINACRRNKCDFRIQSEELNNISVCIYFTTNKTKKHSWIFCKRVQYNETDIHNVYMIFDKRVYDFEQFYKDLKDELDHLEWIENE